MLNSPNFNVDDVPDEAGPSPDSCPERRSVAHTFVDEMQSTNFDKAGSGRVDAIEAQMITPSSNRDSGAAPPQADKG